MNTKLVKLVGIGLLACGASACSSSSSPLTPSAATVVTSAEGTATAAQPAAGSARGADKRAGATIVEIVLANDGEFDVLQAAVIRAGLVDALNGNGQRTVFAPTDAAFVSTLGAANEAAAIAAVNSLPVETLTNILLYHVTSGRRSSQAVLAAPSYPMLNGSRLTQQTLLAAGFVQTDIAAANGVIHVIGAVLMP